RDVALLRESYNPLARSGLKDALGRAIRTLDEAVAGLGGGDDELLRLLATERTQAADALLLDAGILVDVVAGTPTPVPGTVFDLTVTIWNGGSSNVALNTVRPTLPRGW